MMYSDKHGHNYKDTKDYFIKQISHWSQGAVIFHVMLIAWLR